jgi:putative transposase
VGGALPILPDRRRAILSPHECRTALGATAAERCAAYREIVGGGLDEMVLDEIRRATNGGFVLGNPRFEAEIARTLGRRVTRGSPGRPSKQRETG